MSSLRLLRQLGHRNSLAQARFSTVPPSLPKARRPWTMLAAVTTASIVAGTLGAIYPPPPIAILYPRPAPAPMNPNTPEAQAYTEDLEEKLQSLPLLQKLRSQEDAKDWYEVRPYQAFPEERRVNHLTAGSLRGPGKLAVYPLLRVKNDETESIIVLHLGRGLCGHDGIVHGGLLATLLDESLGRTAICNLPERVGVTATLSLNYKAPTMADQFVVLRTKMVEVKGRKAYVSGHIEDLNGTRLVEASAMFVQPRYAKLLNTDQLKKVMGERPKEPLLLADGQDLHPERTHR
ncbi:HotDog domain-containing protein [Crepidotus variabilis]|uniref:HotDog domain-containing protein n=1 Tax=Crepidotus variabilis TaxID=179855 RepID=A0A9P6JPN2_9AGAR|nr:HotDog domain-containing protein [Crepidotus variabilis]